MRKELKRLRDAEKKGFRLVPTSRMIYNEAADEVDAADAANAAGDVPRTND